MFMSNPRRTRVLSLLMAVLLVALPVWSHAALSDQWYKDHAKRMVDQMEDLLNDAAYMTAFVSMPQAQETAGKWRTALLEQQPTLHLFPTPILEQSLRLTEQGAMIAMVRGMGDVARKRLEDMSLWLVHNHVLSHQQDENSMGIMIAGNALTLGEYAQVPEGFENTLVVYDYGTFVIVVTFADRGPGVLINTLVSSPALLEKLQGLP